MSNSKSEAADSRIHSGTASVTNDNCDEGSKGTSGASTKGKKISSIKEAFAKVWKLALSAFVSIQLDRLLCFIRNKEPRIAQGCA